ncbi:hypothetical protein [Polyangium sp. 15x6]|uniref:hypothetical protein n=1 Tax=Polyangium sp. 15x6 TaxID=3042687 RepID=UPI00249BDC87|nr:hypothetical protein [Polyangium sp. 15x6]MDI3291797.1 hypothetical protein [Polyangium sp. 15x6]
MNLAIPILLLATAAPASTRAARPAACASDLGRSGYEAGYDAQSRVLDRLWSDHRESCDAFNEFKNQAVIALGRDPPADVFLRCRRAGMIQAFNDAISRIASTCATTCALELEPYTRIAARIFCNGANADAFALALQREGVATPPCAGDDWTTCKQKVKTEAEAACPDKVASRPDELDPLAAAACQSPQ